MSGSVALVLHAHLPYVRHPEHARSLEERWLYEAMWESYLPLVDALHRLEKDGLRAPLTISISPTLAEMLDDELLRRRFDEHLARLERLALSVRGFVATDLHAALDFHRARVVSARATWDRLGGDVLGELVRLARAERLELWTTAATHAYLPGLLATPALLAAEIRLGIAAFEAHTQLTPRGFWLPECAFDPTFAPALARAGVRTSIVDAHGLELARPRPRDGMARPVLCPKAIAFFARDPDASEDVWSRRTGYPGDPLYRDFYRDLGFDLPLECLSEEVGPLGTRLATGLKLHRVTGPGDSKAPYDPIAAERRALEHAHDFVDRRIAMLADLERSGAASPILVAPFDAELFGHWWFEGPMFLEEALRALDDSALRGGPKAVLLSEELGRTGPLEIVEPAASSWGEGGFGEAWTSPESASLLRHIHHTERVVLRALGVARHATGVCGRAMDQALVELLLLASSDFAFMLHRREMVAYAEARVSAHASRAMRLSQIAMLGVHNEEAAVFVGAIEQRDALFESLKGEALRSAFDEQ